MTATSIGTTEVNQLDANLSANHGPKLVVRFIPVCTTFSQPSFTFLPSNYLKRLVYVRPNL